MKEANYGRLRWRASSHMPSNHAPDAITVSKCFQGNDFFIEIAFFFSLVCSPQGAKEATMVFDGGVPLPICLQIMLQMPLLHQLFARPAFSAPSCPPQL